MKEIEISVDTESLESVIEDKYSNDHENLIMILQDINALYRYLPQETLFIVSEKLGIPLSQVYSVAKFYKTFCLEPRGEHIINVCLGTACHVRGGERIKERLEETLGVDTGNTTEDGRFTIESVRCVGCCSLGPVVRIGEDTHGRITSDRIEKILDEYE